MRLYTTMMSAPDRQLSEVEYVLFGGCDIGVCLSEHYRQNIR